MLFILQFYQQKTTQFYQQTPSRGLGTERASWTSLFEVLWVLALSKFRCGCNNLMQRGEGGRVQGLNWKHVCMWEAKTANTWLASVCLHILLQSARSRFKVAVVCVGFSQLVLNWCVLQSSECSWKLEVISWFHLTGHPCRPHPHCPWWFEGSGLKFCGFGWFGSQPDSNKLRSK